MCVRSQEKRPGWRYPFDSYRILVGPGHRSGAEHNGKREKSPTYPSIRPRGIRWPIRGKPRSNTVDENRRNDRVFTYRRSRIRYAREYADFDIILNKIYKLSPDERWFFHKKFFFFSPPLINGYDGYVAATHFFLRRSRSHSRPVSIRRRFNDFLSNTIIREQEEKRKKKTTGFVCGLRCTRVQTYGGDYKRNKVTLRDSWPIRWTSGLTYPTGATWLPRGDERSLFRY